MSSTTVKSETGRPLMRPIPNPSAADAKQGTNVKSEHGRPATPPTPSPADAKRAMYTTKNELKFPFLLHDVLKDAHTKGFDDIIAWLPEGDGFRILDPSTFANEIMPKYFTMSHYKSFQRQLSLYSFKRETEGRRRDAYCHPFFRRDNRDLCVYVPREKKRTPKRKNQRKIKTLHRRALSSEEVRNLMNSPSVSPITGDYAEQNYSNASHPGVTVGQQPMIPITNSQGFFAEADQLQQHQQSVPISNSQGFFAEANQMPQPQQQYPHWQQLLPQHHQQLQQASLQQLPSGQPLQFPAVRKPWMSDHDANLWNYVNGLVVDSSQVFDDKKELAKEASNFSTDEILTEIASTFNENDDGRTAAGPGRSVSMDSNSSSSSNMSGISPLQAYPSLSSATETPQQHQERESLNGGSYYGL